VVLRAASGLPMWASGLTYLSPDSIAPVALWEVPTSPFPKNNSALEEILVPVSKGGNKNT
jgi:hypothetical protein